MRSKTWMEHIVTPEEAGLTVEQIAREKMHVSGRMLQRLTRSKGIQLNRKQPFLQRKVKAGDCVSVRIVDRLPQDEEKLRRLAGEQKLPGSARASQPTHPSNEGRPHPLLDLLYEDEYYVVVNKQPGVIVHPVNQQRQDSLVEQLNQYFRQQQYREVTAHAIHRLDKQTSGTILLAKSSYAHQAADKMMRAGGLYREYLAVVSGYVDAEQGTICEPIARDPNHRLKRRVSPTGEEAVSHFEVIHRDSNTTLVRVWLETGRTHQIRVHFAHLGYPLAGDRLYGGERHGFQRQALHAWKLSFPHPLTAQQVSVSAPLPEDFARYIPAELGEQLKQS